MSGWLGKAPILIAVKDASGVIHDMDTTSMSHIRGGLIAQGIQATLLGVITCIFGIGLLFLGIAIYFFMRARKFGRLIRLSEGLASGKVLWDANRISSDTVGIPLAA